MPVFVDRLLPRIPSTRWPWRKSCHLWPQHVNRQSLETLHAFALSIGLRPSWFQPHHLPHYDLNESKRKFAVDFGACQLIDPPELGQFLDRLRNEVIEASALEEQRPSLFNQPLRDPHVPF